MDVQIWSWFLLLIIEYRPLYLSCQAAFEQGFVQYFEHFAGPGEQPVPRNRSTAGHSSVFAAEVMEAEAEAEVREVSDGMAAYCRQRYVLKI
jgi:hypothetical protein